MHTRTQVSSTLADSAPAPATRLSLAAPPRLERASPNQKLETINLSCPASPRRHTAAATRGGLALALALALCAGLAVRSEERAEQAQKLLKQSGIRGGLAVYLPCDDPRIAMALAANSFLFHGLDIDARKLDANRQELRTNEAYGGRLSLDLLAGPKLPYADNLVNLLILEQPGMVDPAEALRVLAPGGVLFTKLGNDWKMAVKPRPAEMDEWTHFLHGPDNNAVSKDTLLDLPRRLQWVGPPKWARSHDHLATISAVVSAGGRVFNIEDRGPTAAVALPSSWFLVARDAFNGVELWNKPIDLWEGRLRGFRSGPSEVSRRLVAVGDRVYATLGYGKPVTALDAATGELVRTYNETGMALEIVCHEGRLYVVAGSLDLAAAQEAARAGAPVPAYRKKRLVALEAAGGKLLWQKADDDTAELMPTTLAVGGGRVFFHNPAKLLCLDADSGREVWNSARALVVSRMGWSSPTLVLYRDVVLSADRKGPPESVAAATPVEWAASSGGGNAPPGELIAFSAKDGKRLWSAPCRELYNSPTDVLVAGGLVWTGDQVKSADPGMTEMRDPFSGEVKLKRQPDSQYFPIGFGHHRCYRNKATEKYILMGRSGVEFIEVASGKATANHWVRGACQYGIMPANGLLYVPPHACACYIEAKLNGFNALCSQRAAPPAPRADAERTERGPAFGAALQARPAGDDDWPAYRRDAARHGASRSSLPPQLKQAWQSELRGKLTAPVVADGKLFVAQPEVHTVLALEAATGKQLWRRVVGGRVDSPPAYCLGRVLFGCADGFVYCLRADDGQLIWRFQAAPEDRRIVAYGQLESLWPVPGSILVLDDQACFAAGRSGYLDGGMWLCQVDVATGKLVRQRPLSSRDPKSGIEPYEDVRGTNMSGFLPDVLAFDGKQIFLRQAAFGRDLAPGEPTGSHLFSPAGFLDDDWWHRTYWQYGVKMGTGYGGWPTVGNRVPSGRILVIDDGAIYGFGRQSYATSGAHVGLNAKYRLFAAGKDAGAGEGPAAPPAKGERGGKKKGAAAPAGFKTRWSVEVPIQARGLVLAGKTLFLAGPPEGADADGPGLRRADAPPPMLIAVAIDDGRKLSEQALEASPVFDGLIAAGQRLFVCGTDGKVVCFGP